MFSEFEIEKPGHVQYKGGGSHFEAERSVVGKREKKRGGLRRDTLALVLPRFFSHSPSFSARPQLLRAWNRYWNTWSLNRSATATVY